MTLEDHAGDVLSKARAGGGIGVEAAAQAAGLTLEAYRALEESGQADRVNWGKLASMVGVDSAKLERLAGGWTPPVVDLAQCREVRQLVSKSARMSVSCYLVWDEVTREAALFDTGFDAEAVAVVVASEALQLKHIFITHSHYDHIEALPRLRELYPKARLHSGSKNAPPEHRNRSNDFIHLGSLRITNRETTGHAEDGVTYLIGNFPEDAPGVAIVGDALFAGSMGGARELLGQARQKVVENIFSLPSDTIVCPGHGPVTTVATEKAHNPFF